MATRQARFAAVWRAHHGAVRRYVARRIDAADADDAVAEVFTVVWRRLDDVPDTAEPWLYGVARRVLANEFRGARRRDALLDVVRDRVTGSVHDGPPDPADTVTEQLAAAAAFDVLDEDDREVLRLVAWEDLGAAGIAVVLGCRRTTAAMRVNRARRRLVAAMAHVDVPDADTRLTGRRAVR